MEMVSGARPVSEEVSMRLSMDRSYGTSAAGVECRMGPFVHILVLLMALITAGTAFAQAPANPLKIVVLGDSLSAGLGLPAPAAFPARLQKSLEAKGLKVDMTNAGGVGDAASRRGARLRVS